MKDIENIRKITKKCFQDLSQYLHLDASARAPAFDYPNIRYEDEQEEPRIPGYLSDGSNEATGDENEQPKKVIKVKDRTIVIDGAAAKRRSMWRSISKEII